MSCGLVVAGGIEAELAVAEGDGAGGADIVGAEEVVGVGGLGVGPAGERFTEQVSGDGPRWCPSIRAQTRVPRKRRPDVLAAQNHNSVSGWRS